MGHLVHSLEGFIRAMMRGMSQASFMYILLLFFLGGVHFYSLGLTEITRVVVDFHSTSASHSKRFHLKAHRKLFHRLQQVSSNCRFFLEAILKATAIHQQSHEAEIHCFPLLNGSTSKKRASAKKKGVLALFDKEGGVEVTDFFDVTSLSFWTELPRHLN